ncbi:MAG: hypothetical protein RLZZ444_685 [Pseudomonadota bacterium]
MLGRRDPQRKLFSAAQQLGEEAIKKLGFYGRLATEGYKLFRDEDFVGAYCEDNGRPSIPPSLMILARLLQHYDGVSDAEVVARTRYDIRWKVALDLDLASINQAFAKSTFQVFRARLTLHHKEALVFERSVRAAKEAGLLPKRLRVALDSSPVRGRGAVKDTFNLLSDAIVAVLRAIGIKRSVPVEDVAREADLQRHTEAPSIKGTEMVDWTDSSAVTAFLAGLVADCERAVQLADQHKCAIEEVALLKKVIEQDIETDAGGSPKIRQGVAKDRTVSVHDSEMRHGHKSTGKGYNGHKAHVAVDTESGVITAIEVTSPGEADGSQVKTLIEQTVANTEVPVQQALGDTAYSSATAVSQATEANVDLIAKMPSAREGRFGPEAFRVGTDGRTATCPAGHPSVYVHRNKDGVEHCWSEKLCAVCPLRDKCTTGKFRSLRVTPNFHDRRERERYVRSKEGRLLLRQRVGAEHAIGRLKNLGAGVARCFGRTKTKIEWMWYAAVSNLSLVWAAREAPVVG